MSSISAWSFAAPVLSPNFISFSRSYRAAFSPNLPDSGLDVLKPFMKLNPRSMLKHSSSTISDGSCIVTSVTFVRRRCLSDSRRTSWRRSCRMLRMPRAVPPDLEPVECFVDGVDSEDLSQRVLDPNLDGPYHRADHAGKQQSRKWF